MTSTTNNNIEKAIIEGGTDAVEEPTSPVHPVAPYPPLLATSADPSHRKPVKRAAGGRAPEFYGFTAWLVTLLVYLLYLLWALLPDDVIRAVGIEWYPAREWAILLPAWSVVLFLTAYFVYIALGIYGTPGFSSMSALTDPRAHCPAPVATTTDSGKFSSYIRFSESTAIPAPYDLPPALVNRVLYGRAFPRTQKLPNRV